MEVEFKFIIGKEHICDTVVSFYRAGKLVDSVYRKMQVEPQGLLSFETESKEDFLVRMDKLTIEHDLDIRYGHDCQKILVNDNTL